jgi:hypothetical protein
MLFHSSLLTFSKELLREILACFTLLNYIDPCGSSCSNDNFKGRRYPVLPFT